MRTTVTLDDDVLAVIRTEQRLTGESSRQVINRLIRTATRDKGFAPPLPLLPGRLQVDISDVSSALAMLEDESSQ